MRNIVSILTFVVMFSLGAYAQSSTTVSPIETKIYFRLGESHIDLNYKENKNTLEHFITELNSIAENDDYTIRRIIVTGSSSPEGNSVYNQELSDKRTESLYRWVGGLFPEYKHLIKKKSIGVDWDQLKEIVENSYVPYKERVIDIIENTPIWIRRGGKIVDGRVKQLKDLDDGHVWRYMYNNFFAEMRMAGGGIICEIDCKRPEANYWEEDPSIVISSKRSLVLVNGDTTSYTNNDTFSVIPKDTIHLEYKDTIRISNDSERFQQVIEEALEDSEQQETGRKKRDKGAKSNVSSGKGFHMALKTNMLYDVALVPNIGADFHLGKGWTIGGNWMYAWWSMESYNYFHRVAGGDINVRKYFGARASENPLTGHHLGVYGQILTYDLEYGKRGQLADKWSCGAGIEYGYSFPVARKLNIDLTVGAGYFTGKYENYIPDDGHYVWQSTYMRRWIGPTKAEISLIWLLGRNNYNNK